MPSFGVAVAEESSGTSNMLPERENLTRSCLISMIFAPETTLPSFIRKSLTTARRAERSSCQAMPEILMFAGAAIVEATGAVEAEVDV